MSIQITFTVETTEEAQALIQRFENSSSRRMMPPVDSPKPSQENTSVSQKPSDSEPASTEPQQPELLVSAIVRKYAEDNGVDVTTIEGTGKDGRILKKDVTAAIATPDPVTAPDDDDLDIDEGNDLDLFDLDDEDEEPPAATKEDVRKVLVTLQSAVRDKLIEDGEDETEAKKKAMDKTRSFLKKISGSDTLGGIEEDSYQSIVDKAEAQITKLTK